MNWKPQQETHLEQQIGRAPADFEWEGIYFGKGKREEKEIVVNAGITIFLSIKSSPTVSEFGE